MMQIGRTEKYEQMRTLLNEKQWRQFLALEAQERGNLAQVAREAGVSKNTIRHGMREVEAGDRYSPGARVRQGGGGRKKVVLKVLSSNCKIRATVSTGSAKACKMEVMNSAQMVKGRRLNVMPGARVLMMVVA